MQLLVPKAMRLVCFLPQTLPPLRFVRLIIPFAPHGFAVVLKCEDVGSNTV
jgi:hypothetical protein